MTIESVPRVSVICAAYNGQAFLPKTINALIGQTEKSFEVIIVDDASTDGTSGLLSNVTDPRFRTIKNEINRQLIFTRNRAIENSIAPYVAVTDQDDVSSPSRLAVQASVLDRDPALSAVYSYVSAIDETGSPTTGLPDWPYSGEAARAGLIFHNFVTHSSLMFRRNCAPGPVYSSEYPLCEDYNLLVHLADKGSGLALIKDRLLAYRYHASNHSKSTVTEMSSLSRQLRRALLGRLGLNPSEGELRLHDAFESSVSNPSVQFYRELRDWALHLQDANRRAGYVERIEFDHVLASEWLSVSHSFSGFGRDSWAIFSSGPSLFKPAQYLELTKLWLKTRRLKAGHP
jgi:glycosyltransferase involved in cell wall biosynthesis